MIKLEKEKFLIVEVTEEELAMLAEMRERAKEEPQPQEEEKTYIFTINVNSELVGTIKVDKKQNDLLDWLFFLIMAVSTITLNLKQEVPNSWILPSKGFSGVEPISPIPFTSILFILPFFRQKCRL